MKKWIALLLALVMVFCLMTACGKENKNESEPQSGSQSGTHISTEPVTEASSGDMDDYTPDALPASNGDVVEEADSYPASDGDIAS